MSSTTVALTLTPAKALARAFEAIRAKIDESCYGSLERANAMVENHGVRKDEVGIWHVRSSKHPGEFEVTDVCKCIEAQTAWEGRCEHRLAVSLAHGRDLLLARGLEPLAPVTTSKEHTVKQHEMSDAERDATHWERCADMDGNRLEVDEAFPRAVAKGMAEARQQAPTRFAKAQKGALKLRMALAGPAGSGKSYTALTLASTLGERIAVIDTEHGGASYYADQFTFDTLALTSFHPERYMEAIQAAGAEGYEVLIIDSLSHAWMGKDGALELVDRATKRSHSNNSFTAWSEVTPLQRRLIETILGAPLHVIVTLRSKMEYVIEADSRGKQIPKKVGMAPIQRDGVEYEFDLVADMDLQHTLVVTKSRLHALADKVIERPGRDFGVEIQQALS